jgi:hypothetical protein
MKRISSLEASLLKKIADSSAQLFTNSFPNYLYINDDFVESDCIAVIQKFVALGFLDITQGFSSDYYRINDAGRLELLKYYWKN